MVIHDGLRAMAERAEELEFAGGATDARSLLSLLSEAEPDLLILDLRFGSDDGFAVCRTVREAHPELVIMFFSAFGDVDLLREGLEAGGSGYILKDASTAALPAAIRQVMETGTYVDARLASEAVLSTYAVDSGQSRRVTERERVILKMLAHGKVNREIAAELSLSPHTIKFYVSRMMRDFDVHRRAELVRVAIDRQLIR